MTKEEDQAKNEKQMLKLEKNKKNVTISEKSFKDD
jgi:hypothetical protein